MSDSKNLFAPVGKAMMLGVPELATGKTIVIFDASQVPEGCDLYVQPSVGRLKLEVEVANDNCLHFKELALKRGGKMLSMRRLLRELQQPASGLAPDLVAKIEKLLQEED
jgi:hypothetical protein